MSKIILLNGASSSGKTSIAKELISSISTPFFRLSSDQLIEGGILPMIERENSNSPFYWHKIRSSFFTGFHLHIKAFADAGNNLIVDHIIEFPEWDQVIRKLLASHDLTLIGIHCELEELEKRERERGDRSPGEARSHLLEDKIHSFMNYHYELNTTNTSPTGCAQKIIKFLDIQ